MRLYRAVALACPAALIVGVLGAAPAVAAPAPDYEAPFPCGEEWVGTTRSSHSPSVYSVDFNRPDDIGDLAVATAPGVVSRVTDTGSSSYGKYIIVDHADGNTSLYAHLLAQYVTTGQQVDQGGILGLVGTSGGSTGPHLHFEQRLLGRVLKPFFHQIAYVFGRTLASRNCPDVPIAGDWDGDGTDEVSIFRRKPGNGKFRLFRTGRKPLRVRLGYSADTPVTGDWDGDGRTDVGVKTSGSKTYVLRKGDGSTAESTFGRLSDLPATGDWDGDGVTDLGVWRPSRARFRMRVAAGDVRVLSMGNAGSLPVTGDWDGDGDTDLGIFDASAGRFTLRHRPVKRDGPAQTIRFGSASDLPVAGDWNGDGRTDLGVWSPRTGIFSMRVTQGSDVRVTTKRVGRPRVE